MKTLIAFTLLTIGLAAFAAGETDFSGEMKRAADLSKKGKNEEAVAAYVALAEKQTELPKKFEALSEAAKCARLKLRSEKRALEICDTFNDETYRLGCRAVVYQWASSPKKVLEDLGDVDMLQWPENLAATGYMVRGQAHFREKHGEQARDDFVRAYQLNKGRPKWSAIQRLGDTFRDYLDDEILAEACYRKAMKSGGFGWSGLQARVNLADLLTKQKRCDEALELLDVKQSGSWGATMLIGAAKAHLAKKEPEKAKEALQKALKLKGTHPHQQKQAENMLSEIKNGTQ